MLKRVWNMYRALLAPPTGKMGMQQARRSPFVFCNQFYTLTLSHDCFLPPALIQSLARMLLSSLCHSLAFFLLPRHTRLLTFFLLLSFLTGLPRPYLPYSLNRVLPSLANPVTLACFLPASLPHSLVCYYPPYLAHSLTRSFACFLPPPVS